MKSKRLFGIIVAVLITYLQSMHGEVTEQKYGSFNIIHELTLPGPPVTIYDAMTGDISGWWDHSFSESPLHFYIEAVF